CHRRTSKSPSVVLEGREFLPGRNIPEFDLGTARGDEQLAVAAEPHKRDTDAVAFERRPHLAGGQVPHLDLPRWGRVQGKPIKCRSPKSDSSLRNTRRRGPWRYKSLHRNHLRDQMRSPWGKVDKSSAS